MTGSADERIPHSPAVRSLETDDGITLIYRAWEVDRPRACVRIVHGLGEHGGRYARLADALVTQGVAVFAADLRGHGVSGGRRGHARQLDEFLSDLERLAGEIGCTAPQFIFGHSLGGLIALRAVQTGRAGELTGLVLSAPALQLPQPVRRWRDPAAAILSLIAPVLELPSGIDPEHLSHAPDEVAAYRTDPLVHDRITPRLFVGMRRAMRSAASEAERVEVPVLLLVPGEDRIVDAATARAVGGRFGGETDIREYPGWFHEPLHERQGAEVVGQVVAWILNRIR